MERYITCCHVYLLHLLLMLLYQHFSSFLGFPYYSKVYHLCKTPSNNTARKVPVIKVEKTCRPRQTSFSPPNILTYFYFIKIIIKKKEKKNTNRKRNFRSCNLFLNTSRGSKDYCDFPIKVTWSKYITNVTSPLAYR